MVTAITHTTDIIITMVLTMVLQDDQTTTMVIEQAWDQKLAPIELILIDVLQQEQMVL